MHFTGVKVFSATKAKEREELGETVTRWLRSNADLEIVDRVVTQSSDDEFHCLRSSSSTGRSAGAPVLLRLAWRRLRPRAGALRPRPPRRPTRSPPP